MVAYKKFDGRQLRKGALAQGEAPPLSTAPRALESNDPEGIHLKGMPGGKQMRPVVNSGLHRAEGPVLQGRTGRGAAVSLYELFLSIDYGEEFKNHVAASGRWVAALPPLRVRAPTAQWGA